MTLRKTNIPTQIVQRLIADLDQCKEVDDHGEIRAPFTLDLDSDRATHPASATVEHLAGQLEENIMLRDLTTFHEELN